MLFAPYSRLSQGYSLVELAVVLAMIGLITGLSVSVGKTMLDVSELNGTEERLQTIRSALLLFQKKHKRYPCPALPGDTPTSATYGKEVDVAVGCETACPAGLTCDSSAVIGAVPFKTLKLNEELAYDSWDGKIDYIVDKNHTQNSHYNTGGIPIVDIHGNEITASPVLGDAIFVLVSHGKDGKGAYGKSGVALAACSATGKDSENCNGDDTFADSRLNVGDIDANYYDDLILWQTQEAVQAAPGNSRTVDFTFATGEHHTCAIKPDGTAACWGAGANLRLGDGTGNDQLTPTAVTGLTNAIQISAADWVSHAVTSDGNAWGWGGGGFSPLGDGTANGYATPRLLFNGPPKS